MSRVELEQLVLAGVDPARREHRLERVEDALLPVDQRAVAVERDRVEAAEVEAAHRPRTHRMLAGSLGSASTSLHEPVLDPEQQHLVELQAATLALAARPIERGGPVVRGQHVDQRRRCTCRPSPSAGGRGRRRSRSRPRERPRHRAAAGHDPRRVVGEDVAQREALLVRERVEDLADERLVLSACHGSPPSGRSGPRRAAAAPRRSRSAEAGGAPRPGRRSRPRPRAARARASAGAAAVRSQRRRLTVSWSAVCAIERSLRSRGRPGDLVPARFSR